MAKKNHSEDKREQAIAKAEALSAKLNVKVHPIIFSTVKDPDDLVIGFIKEPQRLVKMRAMDRVNVGQFSAAYAEILEVCLIKEDSDPRILSEAPENDAFNLGALTFCGSLLTMSVNQASEKKS